MDSIAAWLPVRQGTRPGGDRGWPGRTADVAGDDANAPEIADLAGSDIARQGRRGVAGGRPLFCPIGAVQSGPLLIRQALEMVGKSFVEVMRMLVPEHAKSPRSISAATSSSICRSSGWPACSSRRRRSPESEPTSNRTSPFARQIARPRWRCSQHVAAFFRTAEPSSPIPFLIDRARELAQRDFLSLLQDVLPEGALKTIRQLGSTLTRPGRSI